LRGACNNEKSCSYQINTSNIGDPSFGCAKTYIAEYKCGSIIKNVFVRPEANGSWISLTCTDTTKLDRDIRSDETKNDKYYKKNDDKNPSKSFFKEKGDGTTLKKQSDIIRREDKDVIVIGQQYNNQWRQVISEIYGNINKNSKSLNDHIKLVVPIISEYLLLNAFGLITARVANKELNMAEILVKLYEDK